MTNNKRFGPCPVCMESKSEVLFSTEKYCMQYHIVQCAGCGLARTFPFPDEEFLHTEEIFFYYGKEKNKFIPTIQKVRDEMMRYRAKYYLPLIPDSSRKPRILDVGCAEGRLLSGFLKNGCECWGIEHASYPASRFINAHRIRYLQGDFHTINFPEKVFDLIFLWHALEHMDDPQLVMNRLYKLLSPEGAIILAVPNFSSLESKRFKQFWFHLDVPWHKYHFDEISMKFLAKRNKYRIMSTRTRCFEQGPYGLIQSLLNAMGWPHNEFYEAMKGNRMPGRAVHLLIQSCIVMIFLIPSFLTILLSSYASKGSVLKVVLKKERRRGAADSELRE
jgi:SAM-dependent methyltransferase